MPTGRAIRHVAIPAIVSMLFIMLFNLVDAWWVGKLGAAPLAGVSAASFIYWALEAVGTMASTGINSLVARHVGARQIKHAGYVAGHGVLLALFLGITSGAIVWVNARSIMSAMGLTGSALSAGYDYLAIITMGLAVMFAARAVEAVFRGMGDTRTPLKIMGGALALNAILDPFFIFGIGPFPRLDTAGAALATVFAHVIALILSILVLRKRQISLKFRLTFWQRHARNILIRIGRIGAPIALSGVMFSITYALLTRVITRFGAEPLAALGLGHRIEGLAYFTGVGFAVAASTLVGQNIGAGNIRRAEKSAWMALAYSTIVLGVFSLIYFVAAEPLMRFFINDPRVINEGRDYLRIIALCEIFLGFEIVLEGAFAGAGYSLPPMLVSVPLTWLRIPLAAWLSGPCGMGSTGIWWAISLTTGLKGVLIAVWFKAGTWKPKQRQ
jgi:putative MATE family efflux protein